MTSEGTGGISERAGQTARTTQEEMSNVAGTVSTQTREVVHEAKEQARSSLHGVMEDTRQRANEQAAKVAETLHQTSTRLRAMADAGQEQDGQGALATTVVREGATAAERLASRLEQGGADALMADVRAWARRRPGSFLLGAAVTGFLAGRVVRNYSSDSSGSRDFASPNRYSDDWYTSPSARETVDLRDSSVAFESDPNFGPIGGAA
jgi:hypothetical protein